MKRAVRIGASISIAVMLALFVVFVDSCKKKEEEIKIGAVLVLTGPDAKAGNSAKRGIEMAVEEINSEGGVNSLKITVVYEDDQGDPQKASNAVLKLINVDEVPVIIGPMWSTSVLAISKIAEEKQVVILSPTASAPSITEAGDFIFRNTYSDVYEGTKDAEYAYNELGYRKSGIIYINLDAGIEIANVFEKRFEELGGKVLVKENYNPDTTDFRSLLTKFRAKDIEFIYLMGYNEIGQLIKQARELGLKLPFISTIMFEISDVVATAGDAAEGTVYSFPSYDPQKGGNLVYSFAKKYEQKYGELPDPEAAFSYDAMKILALAISEAGTDPIKIKNELYNIQNYKGVTGKTSFDENGDVTKPIGFKILLDGEYVWETFKY